jgi:hypothetical protein
MRGRLVEGHAVPTLFASLLFLYRAEGGSAKSGGPHRRRNI